MSEHTKHFNQNNNNSHSDNDLTKVDIEMSDKAGSDADTRSDISGSSSASSSESDYNFLQRLRRRPLILVCTYCGVIGYGVFGVVFDWLWVSDMLGVEKGLVFGPSSDALVVTLIVVASIGTVSFFFEIADFTMKIYTGEPLFDEDIAQVRRRRLYALPAVRTAALPVRHDLTIEPLFS